MITLLQKLSGFHTNTVYTDVFSNFSVLRMSQEKYIFLTTKKASNVTQNITVPTKLILNHGGENPVI